MKSMRESGDMSTITYINVSLEIFGALLSIIILFFLVITERKKSLQDKLFIRLLVSNAVVQLADAASWVFNGRPDVLGGSIVYIANFLGYCFGYILMTAFGDYAISFLSALDDRMVSRYIRIIRYGAVVAIALTILSQFNGMYYIIDDANVYRRQSLFWLSQLFGILGAGVSAYMVFRCRKNLAKNERLLLTSFVTVVPLALVGQIFTYGITFLYIATTFSGICIYIFIQSEQGKAYAQKELELEKSRTAIMLSQIQPHFIYNTLGTISYLCDHDSQTAKKATMAFSDFLRNNIDTIGNVELIPFETELTHVKNYLWIEKLRFGDRLRIEYDLKVSDFLIPSLTLQPIVENAVRYGVTKKKGGGTVRIKTDMTDEDYIIVVSDDGVGFSSVPTTSTGRYVGVLGNGAVKVDGRTHIGIANVKNRVLLQAGGVVEVFSEENIGTKVTIKIPKKGAKR